MARGHHCKKGSQAASLHEVTKKAAQCHEGIALSLSYKHDRSNLGLGYCRNPKHITTASYGVMHISNFYFCLLKDFIEGAFLILSSVSDAFVSCVRMFANDTGCSQSYLKFYKLLPTVCKSLKLIRPGGFVVRNFVVRFWTPVRAGALPTALMFGVAHDRNSRGV